MSLYHRLAARCLATRRKDASREPAGPFIEPMEPRQLLSTPATAVPWPAAPFTRATTTIYVNQFGYAELPAQRLRASGVNRYEVFFDDPGTALIRTTGKLRTQIAFYDTPGKPRKVTAGRLNGGATIEGVAHSKQILHFAVRGRTAGQSGRYGLYIDGVKHNVVRNLPIRARTAAGTFQTTISNVGDADFYEFTASKSGKWQVSIEPHADLDATLIVFDADGNPIGGVYTKPINAGGPGVAEFWDAPELTAGEQYFIRVDGEGPVRGFYTVRAQHVITPAIGISATGRTASEDGVSGGFVVTRSARSTLDQPVSVNYVVLGSAINGLDYEHLSGIATIPAGSRSVRIDVLPILDAEVEETESVGLILLPGRGYDLTPKRIASIVILDSVAAPAT